MLEEALGLVAMNHTYAASHIRALSRTLASEPSIAIAAETGAVALREDFMRADEDKALVKWTQEDKLQEWEGDSLTWRPRMDAVAGEIAHALVSPFAYYRSNLGEDPYGIFTDTTSTYGAVADEVAAEGSDEAAMNVALLASGIEAGTAGLPTPPCRDPMREAALHNPHAYVRLMAAARLVADTSTMRQEAMRRIQRDLRSAEWIAEQEIREIRRKAWAEHNRLQELGRVDDAMLDALYRALQQPQQAVPGGILQQWQAPPGGVAWHVGGGGGAPLG